MHDGNEGSGSGSGPARRSGVDWDPLVSWLAEVRVQADDVSYGELARRVSERRREAGASAEAARVARSSVYDLFRPGRSRLNLELVRDVAAVLGVEEGELERRLTACRERSGPSTVPASAAEATSAPVAPPEPAPARAPGLRLVLAVVVGCVAANLAGRGLVVLLDLPVHLDMLGTAVAALALGPWIGATVGATTNTVGVLVSGWTSLPFALVNVAGALVWGYGARAGWARTLPRFAGLNLVVALVCTVVAAPILVLLFGGSVGNGQEVIAATLAEMGHSLVVAVTGANALVSVADKLLSGFVALVVLAALPLWWQARLPLPFLAGPPRDAA